MPLYVLCFTNPTNNRRGLIIGLFRFPVGTVYLPSFTSFARDSKWGSLNDFAVEGTLNTNKQAIKQT